MTVQKRGIPNLTLAGANLLADTTIYVVVIIAVAIVAIKLIEIFNKK